IVALDRGLQEPRQHLAVALESARLHHDAAEQPWNLLGREINHRVEAGLAGETRHRLAGGGAFDLARPERLPAPQPAAIFPDDDIVSPQAEARERQSNGGIAFRAERADADRAAFEVGRGPHAGRREESEADDVAERRDGAQIAAVVVELD